MEPLIRSQRSQPEANNSLRASTVMQLSSSDPIEMKDQTPWSVFKINNSVDKVNLLFKMKRDCFFWYYLSISGKRRSLVRTFLIEELYQYVYLRGC